MLRITHKKFMLLDPCHMLKLLRNVFSTVEDLVREDGQQIRWRYIEELHKLQGKEGLRLGNKLKMAHIQWRNQKMKVNLAAQLFSSSVADALEQCFPNLSWRPPCPAPFVCLPYLTHLIQLINSLVETATTELGVSD